MPKLLGELLQEQQEPFVLEAYLLERGCLGKFKPFHTLESCSLKKRLYVGRKILKSVVGQLVAANSRNKVKSLGKNGAGENAGRQCEDANARGSTKRGEVLVCAEGEVIKWGAAAAAEDGKQLSPVSVLSPVNHRKKPNSKAPTQRESSTSASISQHKSNPQTQCSTQELPEIPCPDSYAHSRNTVDKGYVLQTQQLLIDCVTEVLECHSEREKGRIVGGDDVWKLVCEKAWKWSGEPIDETNIIHLVHHEFLYGEKNGDSDEHWRMGVSMEIGDAILGDFIGEVMTSFAS